MGENTCSPAINKVHIVFKTHLDVGFTDFAGNITREYFEKFIPGAIELAGKL